MDFFSSSRRIINSMTGNLFNEIQSLELTAEAEGGDVNLDKVGEVVTKLLPFKIEKIDEKYLESLIPTIRFITERIFSAIKRSCEECGAGCRSCFLEGNCIQQVYSAKNAC
jgi:hypothetical protein